jgi:hypothetical protein
MKDKECKGCSLYRSITTFCHPLNKTANCPCKLCLLKPICLESCNEFDIFLKKASNEIMEEVEELENSRHKVLAKTVS